MDPDGLNKLFVRRICVLNKSKEQMTNLRVAAELDLRPLS